MTNRYEQARAQWLKLNPGATKEEKRKAMDVIAKKLLP